MPFSAMELMDAGGINYSCNISTKNLILYDRLQTQNFNGFILGTPGSGKSFTAKIEMLNVMLGSNARCIILDPESEYSALAKLIGGETIKIMPGGSGISIRWNLLQSMTTMKGKMMEKNVTSILSLGKQHFFLDY